MNHASRIEKIMCINFEINENKISGQYYLEIFFRLEEKKEGAVHKNG